MPAQSGASGPTTVRVIECSLANRIRALVSSTAMGTFSPTAAVPALPGAQKTRVARGERRDPLQPFFDNVGAWAASHGWIGATMSYRRAPEHRWPAGAEDVGSAVRALRALAPRIGGDADRIVLIGHSAGAAHVGGYLAGHGGPVEPGLTCVLVQSGIYDPATAEAEIADIVALYYGGRDVSCAPALAELPVPLWLGVGEHDPLVFHDQAARVGAPRIADGHSHFSAVYSLGLEADYPADVARFLTDALAAAAS